MFNALKLMFRTIELMFITIELTFKSFEHKFYLEIKKNIPRNKKTYT